MNKNKLSHLLSFSLLFGFGLFILIISLIRTSNAELKRRVGASPSPVSHITLQTITSIPKHTDLSLPWPGILPTHPFYKLKMLRDRIGLILTTNPERKSELLLHYANKRIAAAHQLLELGLLNEATTVALKAESYLRQAIATHSDLDILKKSALKHEEVIEELRLLTTADLHNQANHMHNNLSQLRDLIVSRTGESSFGYLRPEDLVNDPISTSSATPSSSLDVPEPRL